MLVLCPKSIVVNLTVIYKRQYAHLNTLISPVKFLALSEIGKNLFLVKIFCYMVTNFQNSIMHVYSIVCVVVMKR